MTSQNDSAPSRQSAASRREFVTVVTAVAAASAAGATSSAKAQAGTNVRHSNPSGMTQPTAYSQVVEVNGPHRLVFVAGQTGVDASGKTAQGFRAMNGLCVRRPLSATRILPRPPGTSGMVPHLRHGCSITHT